MPHLFSAVKKQRSFTSLVLPLFYALLEGASLSTSGACHRRYSQPVQSPCHQDAGSSPFEKRRTGIAGLLQVTAPP